MLPPGRGGERAQSQPPSEARRWAQRDFADRLSWLLDEAFRLPFTRIRFGFDFLFGLVPALGDFVGMALGLPILVMAVRRRLGWRVLVVMLVNMLLDAVLGVVPIAGNLFDLFWKAHRKNLRLLKDPAALGEVLREAGWKLAALAALVVILGATLLAVLVWMMDLYWTMLGGTL